MNIKLKFFIPILVIVLILHIVFLQKVSIVEKKTKVNQKSNFITKLVIVDVPEKIEKKKDHKKAIPVSNKVMKKDKQKEPAKKIKKKLHENKKIANKIIKKVQVDQIKEKEIKQTEFNEKQKNKINVTKLIKKENKSTLTVKSDKTTQKEKVENLNKYILYINKTIQENKFYPKIAKNMGIEGKCILKFKILKSGKITEVNIDRKSEFSVLNKAAVKILEKIGKFEAFPSSLNKEEVVLKIPIKYMLKG